VVTQTRNLPKLFRELARKNRGGRKRRGRGYRKEGSADEEIFERFHLLGRGRKKHCVG